MISQRDSLCSILKSKVNDRSICVLDAEETCDAFPRRAASCQGGWCVVHQIMQRKHGIVAQGDESLTLLDRESFFELNDTTKFYRI